MPDVSPNAGEMAIFVRKMNLTLYLTEATRHKKLIFLGASNSEQSSALPKGGAACRQVHSNMWHLGNIPF
jgi:hypothetical protein